MNILFVCTGNTCRSPMAFGYLSHKKLNNISVKNAGIAATSSPVSENSAAVMAELGIDIKDHISTPITASLIDWADRIYCLSKSHYDFLLKNGINPDKLFVLGGGIFDPFGQDIDTYRVCRDEIISAIEGEFCKIKILSAKKENINDIAEIEKLCFSSPWSQEAIMESFENGTKFFIALFETQVVGYCGINTVLDEGYITNVAVKKDFRNLYIGTALLNNLDNLAKKENLSFISLEVRVSNNAAISLYQKCGYENMGVRKGFYENPKEDAFIMTKRF